MMKSMRRLGILSCVIFFAVATPAYAVDPPNNCPVPPETSVPSQGYVHGGLFSSDHSWGTYISVRMRVNELDIRGGFPSRDHAHGTIAIQDAPSGGGLNNYLEVGIGLFGHRDITSPRFWSFYREDESDPGTFELINGAPIPQLGQAYQAGFHYVGGGSYKIRIDNTDYGFPYYVPDAYWFTVFNENYNESNTLCDPLHVTYSTSTEVLNILRFDHQFDGCHWQNFFSWEVYWDTALPIYCISPDPGEPPNPETPPDFPSTPVAP